MLLNITVSSFTSNCNLQINLFTHFSYYTFYFVSCQKEFCKIKCIFIHYFCILYILSTFLQSLTVYDANYCSFFAIYHVCMTRSHFHLITFYQFYCLYSIICRTVHTSAGYHFQEYNNVLYMEQAV